MRTQMHRWRAIPLMPMEIERDDSTVDHFIHAIGTAPRFIDGLPLLLLIFVFTFHGAYKTDCPVMTPDIVVESENYSEKKCARQRLRGDKRKIHIIIRTLYG